MTDRQLVTIGITCFNARDTIGRALESARTQDWPATEVLIVDDASTDGSADLVASIIADWPNARLVRHAENAGAAVARNTILRAARGEFIAFFDDDDESAPGRISRQVETLLAAEKTAGTGLIACYAGGIRQYANGYTVAAPGIGSRGELPHGPDVANYLLFHEKNPDWFYGAGVPTCALLARRSTYAALDGFDAGLRRNQDVDLAIRLALMGGYFTGTADQLYVRHMTGGSDKSAEAGLEARLTLAEKHRAHLQSVNRYHYARSWPQMRYWHFRRRYGRFALEFVKLVLRNPWATIAHLLRTGPKRLIHEKRMRKGASR